MLNKSDIAYIRSEMEKIKKFFSVQQYETVIEKTKKLLKKDNTQVAFYNYIALSYKQLGKLDEAYLTIKKGLKMHPNNDSLLGNMGSICRAMDKLSEAENFFKRALDVNPSKVSTLVNYGNLKRDQNKINDAIEIYEKARRLDQNLELLLINLAGTYQVIGEFEKSKEVLKDLSQRHPQNTLSDKLYSSIHKYKIDDPHQTKMLEKLNYSPINNENKVALSFAIAKSFADQQDYKNSAKYFLIGNEEKYKMFINYNFNKIEKERFDIIKNIFKNIKFSKHISEEMPNLIFIVGLPRSGTTLAHQIISSHSKVYGAGELTILTNFFSKKIYDTEFKNIFSNIDANQQILNKISDDLISYFKEYDGNKIILDKSPLNFEWIGFIKLLFPNAKIIHCTRNLKDTALSIYKNVFDSSSFPWSYNQEQLIKFINLYKDLFDFWKTKLPGQIYECNYEKLVNNPSLEIPKIVDFLNLEWEDKCLDHTKNKTVIKTVSISQARKPIYKSSVNLSEEYKKYLNFLNQI